MKFGMLLRMYRVKRDVSQVELARKVGMDRYHLSRIERSKVKPPKLSTIRALIKALDLSDGEAEVLILSVSSEVYGSTKKRREQLWEVRRRIRELDYLVSMLIQQEDDPISSEGPRKESKPVLD